MSKVTTQKQYTLNYRDVLRGLLVSVISAVLTALLPIVSEGSFDFNWKEIAAVAVTTGISYLLKNYFTPTEVVVTKIPKDLAKDVKKGKAKVNIS